MVTPADNTLRDVATLTRAVERVFRRLIRMLIGKVEPNADVNAEKRQHSAGRVNNLSHPLVCAKRSRSD